MFSVLRSTRFFECDVKQKEKNLFHLKYLFWFMSTSQGEVEGGSGGVRGGQGGRFDSPEPLSLLYQVSVLFSLVCQLCSMNQPVMKDLLYF